VRYFAGLDVSLEEAAICIVDESRKESELRASINHSCEIPPATNPSCVGDRRKSFFRSLL